MRKSIQSGYKKNETITSTKRPILVSLLRWEIQFIAFFALSLYLLFSHPAVQINVNRNTDEISQTTGAPSSAEETPTAITVKSESFGEAKVVILPGPHKSGSTSLQYCMSYWTQNWLADENRQIRFEAQVKAIEARRQQWREDRLKLGMDVKEENMPPQLRETLDLPPQFLPQWSWPAPLEPDLEEAGLIFTRPVKAFAALMVLANEDLHFVSNFQPLKPTQREHLYSLYETKMVEAWQQNNRIVFGSEEFDQISHPNKQFTPTEMLDSILRILPWDDTIKRVTSQQSNLRGDSSNDETQRSSLTKDELEAVVIHRSPRIEHLRSLWHQVAEPTQSFRDFLTLSPGKFPRTLTNSAEFFDSIALADRFVEYGIHTTLIDMDGIKAYYNLTDTSATSAKTNICHIVSCDILGGVDCNDQGKISRLHNLTEGVRDTELRSRMDISYLKQNVREDSIPLGLSENQLEAIDQVLERYDCGYKQGLVTSSKFRILYQHKVFSQCNPEDSSRKSIYWMIEEVQKIALSESPTPTSSTTSF